MGEAALTLALKEKPDQELLEQFASSHPRLVIDGDLGKQNSVVVGREREGFERSFEAWRPLRAFENEDLDPKLAALVSVPCWLFQVTLEKDHVDEDWELANDFARFVAITCKGAVFYDELGEIIWPKIDPKKAGPDVKGRIIDLVNLEWFVHLSNLSLTTAGPFLASLREMFPEAVPVRYGTFEPLQGRLEDDDGPFDELWKRSNGGQTREGWIMGLIHFTGKPPCFGGFIGFPPELIGAGKKEEEKLVRLKLEFERAPLADDPYLCDRVVSLFVGVAKNLGAFYAHAFVERNYSTYRGLAAMPETKDRPGTEQYPLPIGHAWLGIPPAPAWLHWLGGPYVGLLQHSLQSVQHLKTGEGILIRRGPKPMDLDQLESVPLGFPPRLLAQPIEDPWLKEKHGRWRYRGRPAEFIPHLAS